MANLRVFISLNLVFTNMFVRGQCPDQHALWERLVFLKNSTISPAEKLKELLPYETSMKNCPNKNDSTHAFLLQRLGMAYFGLADYLKAVAYLKESIQINNLKTSSTKLQENIVGYFYLAAAYDSLKNISAEMNAADSC